MTFPYPGDNLSALIGINSSMSMAYSDPDQPRLGRHPIPESALVGLDR